MLGYLLGCLSVGVMEFCVTVIIVSYIIWF